MQIKISKIIGLASADNTQWKSPKTKRKKKNEDIKSKPW